ncbi:hypothetical protein [Actinoplanes sp. OR16]|uniref:hypothetical protein n=1 Tax=Actinoplanes sp. OR16 TaxID=946334 RepID=UPI000FD71A85|nr:hypothetical protein [Actinoplanes sp. OR16]
MAGILLIPKLLDREDPAADGQISPTATEITETVTPETTEPETPTAEPTTPDPTTPTQVGVVTIGQNVTDIRAADIAAMFDTYFGGINAKDYGRVASALDPAGVIDPTDPAQMAAFQEGTRTTQNSEVILHRLGDGAEGTLAEVTFRSTQEAGAGPKGRAGETCTQWSIDYTLTETNGAFRILRGAADSKPC